MSDERAPAGYDFSDDGRLVPKSPSDTAECVFAGNALERIAKVRNISLEAAREIAVDAIGRGQLDPRLRLIGAQEDKFATLKRALTPEVWSDCLIAYQVGAIDRRPWIPVSQRRRIPQPHWLFFTRQSLEPLLRSPPTSGNPGRKALGCWPDVKNRVFELMDDNGEFSKDPGRDGVPWIRQRLIEKILDEFEGRIGETQFKKNLPAMLTEWRATKVGN
jgi:hypothetical protein